MNLIGRLGISAAIVLIALAMMPRHAIAQIQRDTTHWNDEELYQEEDKGPPTFFSVGGGFLGAFFKPDFSGFNSNFAQPFVGKNYREQVWMFGGQGFVTIPWIKNFRVGGMGYSGTSTDCGCIDTVLNQVDTVNRFLTYQVGYAALTLDYVLPLRTGRFHIVPGVALGYGAVNIFARQARNRVGEFNIANDFNPPYQPYTSHTYSSNFFLYMPQLQFEYSPVGYLMFRLTAAYQGTSMGTWTYDQGVGLGSTTAFNGINGSGLLFSLGAFVGLFQ